MVRVGRSGKPRCGDCGVVEGQYHMLGCDMEMCPFCGNQLITCYCSYEVLGLVDRNKYDRSTGYVPLEVHQHGLTLEQEEKWLALLNEKGRIPFIEYPIICGKCGTLWPEFFMVPDEEWEYYIEPREQRKVICRKCYSYIKGLIDETKGPFKGHSKELPLEDLSISVSETPKAKRWGLFARIRMRKSRHSK